MTINIVLVTSDAVVFGCDSLASYVRHVWDPFDSGLTPALDANGTEILDADGNRLYALGKQPVIEVIANAVGGATKMFTLYNNNDTSVAAVCSGLGELEGKPISEVVRRYRRSFDAREANLGTVQGVAAHFVTFVSQQYQQHVAALNVNPAFLPDLSFIVGGTGRDELHPSMFRVSAKTGECNQIAAGGTYTIAWGGVCGNVERLLLGYESQLREQLTVSVDSAITRYKESIAELIVERLNAPGVAIPDGFEFALPDPPPIEFGWNSFPALINYRALPLQYGIDLVSFLVNAEAAMQRFASAIASVGGRTHIGYIRSGNELSMLNEPTLTHKMVGFSDET